MILSDKAEQSWVKADCSLCFPSPSLSSLYSAPKATHAIATPTPTDSPALRPRVNTQRIQRRRRQSSEALILPFLPLQRYKRRINNFSLLPCKQAVTASGAGKYSSSGCAGDNLLSYTRIILRQFNLLLWTSCLVKKRVGKN